MPDYYTGMRRLLRVANSCVIIKDSRGVRSLRYDEVDILKIIREHTRGGWNMDSQTKVLRLRHENIPGHGARQPLQHNNGIHEVPPTQGVFSR